MKINNDNNLQCIAFSVLKMVLPYLNRSDITRVRFALPKSSTSHNQKITTEFPSFIITLKNPELVQLVMRTKKSFNYLTTKDIELSSLSSEVATALPDKKIFIKEVLSSTARNQYIFIKETAQRLGFKFVWHSSGDFLVRWRNGMRVHIVK